MSGKKKWAFNNRFLRERGMASNPKMEYQVFLCIFQKNSVMATIGLKEMGKFLFKSKAAIAKFIGKMKKKVWYEKWVGRHASFSPRRFVKAKVNFLNAYLQRCR